MNEEKRKKVRQDERDARMRSAALIQGLAVIDAKEKAAAKNKFKDWNEESEKKSKLFYQNVIGPRAKIEADLMTTIDQGKDPGFLLGIGQEERDQQKRRSVVKNCLVLKD